MTRIEVTRDNIAKGKIRDLARQRDGDDPDLLSDEELRESRRSLVPDNPRSDIWVFGYGSLLWNPALEFTGKCHARIYGYRRRFCLKTGIGRGTPENPGLVLGLDSGGCCTGMGLRIARAVATRELDLLWQREMFGRAYVPRRVRMHCRGGKTVPAITFVIDRAGKRYAGDIGIAEKAAMIASASGFAGPNMEYLERTHEALAALGIHDGYIETIYELAMGEIAGKAPASSIV